VSEPKGRRPEAEARDGDERSELLAELIDRGGRRDGRVCAQVFQRRADGVRSRENTAWEWDGPEFELG
jgi:hypothetical protein